MQHLTQTSDHVHASRMLLLSMVCVLFVARFGTINAAAPTPTRMPDKRDFAYEPLKTFFDAAATAKDEDMQNLRKNLAGQLHATDLFDHTSYNPLTWCRILHNSAKNGIALSKIEEDYGVLERQKDTSKLGAAQATRLTQELPNDLRANMLPGTRPLTKIGFKVSSAGHSIVEDFKEHWLGWSICAFALFKASPHLYQTISRSARASRTVLSRNDLARLAQASQKKTSHIFGNLGQLARYTWSEFALAYDVLANE